MNNSTVYLARISQYIDSRLAYEVFVDDKLIAKIRRNETLCLQLETGEHRLRLRGDGLGSNTLVIKVRDNEDFYLECGNSLGFFPNPFLAIYLFFFMPDSYLYIRIVK